MLIRMNHFGVPVLGQVRRVHQEEYLRREYLHTCVILSVPTFIIGFWHESSEVIFKIHEVVLAEILKEAAKHVVNDVNVPPDRSLLRRGRQEK